MGTADYKNILDILKAGKAVRLREEAVMARLYGHKAANTMRNMGVFYAIIDNSWAKLVIDVSRRERMATNEKEIGVQIKFLHLNWVH